MAEIEFKAEGEGSDPIGQKVGVLAVVLAGLGGIILLCGEHPAGRTSARLTILAISQDGHVPPAKSERPCPRGDSTPMV